MMLYVFSLLSVVTLLLSVFSVDELDQALGGLLTNGAALYLAVIMLILVAVVMLWRKKRAAAKRPNPPPSP